LSTLKEDYFATLEISPHDAAPPPAPAQKSKSEKALDRAYQLRTFEIEHYWKRATYFWGFQIAIFAAFGLLWKDASVAPANLWVWSCPATTNPWSPVTVALSGLGVLTAVANYLSAKGSTFWQKNWEHHIDMLEDKIEGRLYKTVWLLEGKSSYSVSKVNQQLSFFFIVFWVFVTLYVVYRFIGSPPWMLDISAWWAHLSIWMQAIIIIAPIVIGAVCLFQQTSDLRGTLHDSKGSHSYPIERCWCSCKRTCAGQTFISRCAPHYATDKPVKVEDTKVA
jgi:hypothetical protein